jgi:Zn-dependent peptidase ImmA (M78 family)
LSGEQSDRHEREANRFAVELLMPADVCAARADAFRQAYGVCPRGPLAYQLAAELLVSREAMRYRLNELGVGDE